jgi:curved DNA-binding protein CbpA
MQWHPDKNPDNPEAKNNFQKISEAYATLSDPSKRKTYDMLGEEGVRAQEQRGDNGAGPAGPGGGFPPGGYGVFPGGFGGAGPGGTTFHFTTSGFPGGVGGSGRGGGMSQQDAEAFFEQFFGHDDPFGAFSSRRGSPFGGSLGGGGGGIPGFGMPGGSFTSSLGGIPASTGGIPSQRGSYTAGPSQRKRYDAIPAGTVVSLKGLVNRPDRNGDRGEVLDYDPASGRYTVLIEDSDEQIKVKPNNLLQHVHVKIHGLESQQEMNGLRGTIIAWNDQKQRYNIYVMDRSRVVGLKPGNVILEPGTVGMIMGLVSKPELNGRYGRINSWSRSQNRYEVQLSKDQIISVKVENIRV